MAPDTLYGVTTLFQGENYDLTVHGAPNTPQRLEFMKSWIDKSATLGSQVLRIPGNWKALEPVEGFYDNNAVAEAVELIRYAGEQGIQVIYEFGQSPEWARPVGQNYGDFTPPAHPQDYADAAAFLHQEFVNQGVDQYISGWEIWNEPNIAPFWPGATYRNDLSNHPQSQGVDQSVDYAAAAQYVDLLNSTYQALHAVDPKVNVLGGSLAGTDTTYLQWMLDLGAQMDGLAVHPYTRNYDGQSQAPAHPNDDPNLYTDNLIAAGLPEDLNHRWSFQWGLNRLNDILQQNGQNNIDLWITEMGWRIADYNDGDQSDDHLIVADENAQGQYIQEGLDIISTLDFVKAVTLFHLYDTRDGDFGLFRNDGTLRPAGEALLNKVNETFQQGSDENLLNAIWGTQEDDYITNGSDGDDVIYGFDGLDVIVGSKGNDTVYGQSQNSQEYNQMDYTGAGSSSQNFTFTQNDDGSITASSADFGQDILWGIDGIYFAEEGAWYRVSELLNHTKLKQQEATENTIYGSTEHDVIFGTNANDLIIGDAGEDFIVASFGNDTIVGQAEGGSESNQLYYENSEKDDFFFTNNHNGSITVVHDEYGQDLLWGIDDLLFGEDPTVYHVSDLVG